MKLRALAGCAVLIAATTLWPEHTAAQESGGTIVVRGGWLFDSVRGARVRNPGIVVRAGKIMRVGAPGAACNAEGDAARSRHPH